MLLARDIGGTKANLAVFSAERGAREPMAQKIYPSGQYPSLEVIVQEFLGTVDVPTRSGLTESRPSWIRNSSRFVMRVITSRAEKLYPFYSRWDIVFVHSMCFSKRRISATRVSRMECTATPVRSEHPYVSLQPGASGTSYPADRVER